MATVKMISESDATGKVRTVYDEIKATLGIDFVPNLHKVMARYGLGFPWLSFRESEFSMEGLSDSLIDFLKPLMASPRDLPNSGSLLGPKTTRATTKITINSGMPRLPNIQHLLTKIVSGYALSKGCQSSDGRGNWLYPCSLMHHPADFLYDWIQFPVDQWLADR